VKVLIARYFSKKSKLTLFGTGFEKNKKAHLLRHIEATLTSINKLSPNDLIFVSFHH